MTVGAHARRAGFWTLDAARGSPIRRHLDDIRAKASGARDPEERLAPLLEHALRTVPFYASVSSPHLDAFPVVSRVMLQQQPGAFSSSAFDSANLRVVTTSGSSGMPLTVRLDRDKRLRSIADTIHVNETLGYRLGDPLLWLRAWPSLNRRQRLAKRLQNIVAFEVRGLDGSRMEKIIDTVRDQRGGAMLAFTSGLSALVSYIEEHGISTGSLGPGVIINDSEAMPAGLRRRVATAFGCPVADRYANNENGILAAMTPDADEFTLNRASFVFEFLKLDRDEPQEPGKAARVVVTDLYNSAMPLIRYDTGDLAVAAKHAGPRATAIRSLEGRRMELIHDTAGRLISSGMVAVAISPFDKILQYQLRQEDTHAFRLLVRGSADRYPDQELGGALNDLLGAEATVSVEWVAHIPAEESGKTRTVVPLPSNDPARP